MSLENKARRGFLALLGTAPIAAPVALKEAAASMGLNRAVGGSAIGGDVVGYGSGLNSLPSAGSDRTWIQQCLDRFKTPRKQREFDDSARYQARTLDPDLASMRSISPSFAYRRQIDRCRVRIEENERQHLLWQLD